MKESIPKLVGDFRRALAAQHSTFFLVYSDVDRSTGEVVVKATSNSTGAGVGSILAPMLEPTEEAVEMMIKALPRPGWFSSRKKREVQARALLDKLCHKLTLSKMDEKPVAPGKLVVV
jgi:hypothetical protein